MITKTAILRELGFNFFFTSILLLFVSNFVCNLVPYCIFSTHSQNQANIKSNLTTNSRYFENLTINRQGLNKIIILLTLLNFEINLKSKLFITCNY